MPQGKCHLCQIESDLQLSHILPAFTYRWLRESSGNGHIRSSDKPNLRVQDGLKRYWLCSACEGKFGHSEAAFAGKLFYPYLETSGRAFSYSHWLLHFCASISWRVLHFYIEEGHLKNCKPEVIAYALQAEIVWREYLLGQRPHPNNFQQHLLPLDLISNTSRNFYPNINRYLMRAIQLDICQGSQSIFTYAKLGRFIILGFIHEPNLNHWKGSKVHATHGFIEPKKYVIPRAFGEYLDEKAKKMSTSLNSLSVRQQAKIDEAFRSNIEKYIGSDAFTAMQADLNMFGNDAFSK